MADFNFGDTYRPLHGYREDYYDPRDKMYASNEQLLASIPDIIDLRPKWTFAIENQGSQGSCAANATASCIEYILSNVSDSPEVSRSFLYYLARSLRGWQNQDSGSLIRDNIKIAATVGISSEFCMPYNDKDYKTPPTLECIEEAGRHKIGSYYRMSTLDEYLDCLAKGYPFVFGMYLYQDFMNGGKKGVIAMPSGKELGGHAVVACGYDKSKRWLICRNSWGTGWGDGGWFYLPFDYVTSDSFMGDVWAIREIKS